MKISYVFRWTIALAIVICVSFKLCCEVGAQESPNVERAKKVMQKTRAGETLTPDDQAFLERVRADIQETKQATQKMVAFFQQQFAKVTTAIPKAIGATPKAPSSTTQATTT